MEGKPSSRRSSRTPVLRKKSIQRRLLGLDLPCFGCFVPVFFFADHSCNSSGRRLGASTTIDSSSWTAMTSSQQTSAAPSGGWVFGR